MTFDTTPFIVRGVTNSGKRAVWVRRMVKKSDTMHSVETSQAFQDEYRAKLALSKNSIRWA